MRVIVLGSGVVGVTTAYYLAKAGHEVTVIDRQPGPALETSFANAGQISPGYASPWAAPGIPLKAFKWLFQRRRFWSALTAPIFSAASAARKSRCSGSGCIAETRRRERETDAQD